MNHHPNITKALAAYQQCRDHHQQCISAIDQHNERTWADKAAIESRPICNPDDTAAIQQLLIDQVRPGINQRWADHLDGLERDAQSSVDVCLSDVVRETLTPIDAEIVRLRSKVEPTIRGMWPDASPAFIEDAVNRSSQLQPLWALRKRVDAGGSDLIDLATRIAKGEFPTA